MQSLDGDVVALTHRSTEPCVRVFSSVQLLNREGERGEKNSGIFPGKNVAHRV